MQWFSDQIEERRRADQQLLEDSFAKISGVVLGERIAEKIHDQRVIAQSAIDEMRRMWHIAYNAIPECEAPK